MTDKILLEQLSEVFLDTFGDHSLTQVNQENSHDDSFECCTLSNLYT